MNAQKRIIYLLVGVPGVGKSWVGNQLTHLYHYIKHDDYLKREQEYITACLTALADGNKPVLAETPFSESKFIAAFKSFGVSTESFYITMDNDKLIAQYYADRKQSIPPGHLTRNQTFKTRAKENGAFTGDSAQVLKYLIDYAEGFNK